MTEGVNQLLRVFGVTGSLVLAAFLVSRVNLKRRDRYAQFLMPIVALIYCIVAMILFNKLYILAMNLLYQLPDRLIGTPLERLGVAIYGLLGSLSLKFWITVICNVLILLAFMIVKAVLLPIVFGIGKRATLSQSLSTSKTVRTTVGVSARICCNAGPLPKHCISHPWHWRPLCCSYPNTITMRISFWTPFRRHCV